MSILTLGNIPILLSSILASTIVSHTPNYSRCEVNHISTVQQSINNHVESKQFSSRSIDDCDRIQENKLNLSSELNMDHESQQHYYFNHNCEQLDSPFGVSGIIIGDRINLHKHYSRIQDEPILIDSLGFFNVYSFGGTCVFSIYSF